MRTKLLLLAGLMLLGSGGCKKYPENPNFAFWPRKERMEGKWVASEVKVGSSDSTNFYRNWIWEFTRHGTVIVQAGGVKRLGTWTTGNSDEDFVIDYDDGGRETYRILKLLRKEFWIRDKKTELEFHLVDQ
jgi:hypothetical protein